MGDVIERAGTDHTAAGRRVSHLLIGIGLVLLLVSAGLQQWSVDRLNMGSWLWSVVQVLVTVSGAMISAGFIGVVLVALGVGRR